MRVVLAVLALLVCFAGPARAVDRVLGSSTVSLSQDPGYEGLWKYCVTVNWSFERHDLGHLDVFLDLDTFVGGCTGGSVIFPSPAGHSNGEDFFGNECFLDYRGEFLCKTDPSIPFTGLGATVKYEPLEAGCMTGQVGIGTFCFYSIVPPGQATQHGNAVAIKHGREVDFGVLIGSLPLGPGDAPLGDPVVINEFLVRPPTGVEEFIELKNKTADPVSLDGWRIAVYWSHPVFGDLYISEHTYGPADVLNPGGYLVDVTDGENWDNYCYSCIGVATDPLERQSARTVGGPGRKVQALGDDFIFDPGGLIILYDDMGVIIDQVGYGNAGGAPISCPIVVPAGYPRPPGYSVQSRLSLDRFAAAEDETLAASTNRIPDGSDTDNDTEDFNIGSPTPESPNVAATPDLGSSVRINSIYAYPVNGDQNPQNEAIEFFNPNDRIMDIGSWYISDGFLIRPIFPPDAHVPLERSGKFTAYHGANALIAFEMEPDDRAELYEPRLDGLTRVDQIGWIRVPEFFPDACFARSPDGAGPSSGWNWETSGGFVTLFYEANCGLEAPNVAATPDLGGGTQLAPPQPNPAAGASSIGFVVGSEYGAGAIGRVGIYDLAGRRVRTAGEGFYPPGRYTIAWDGRTQDGLKAASGVYFVRLYLDGRPAGGQRSLVWTSD
jgi:hypothetical protein